MRNKILCGIGIFFLLFILFFPLDFLGDIQKNISVFLFGDLTHLIIDSVSENEKIRIDFSSDSISMFILIGLLAGISIILYLLIGKRYIQPILYLAKEVILLYLIIILVKYGLDKIFKAQFYLPEPNILYTRLGNLDRDILFWSTMGTSYFYSVFIGILELCAAIMIFFYRTRLAGLLISLGIFTNILGINLGFDISVKLFSLILLLMIVFALRDDWVVLYRFFILKKESKQTAKVSEILYRPFMKGFKGVFLGLLIIVIAYPYLHSGNYNDDVVRRPFFHGAFKNINERSEIQYIFFHREGYLIFMNQNEKMKDFHYTAVSSNHLLLEDYNGKQISAEILYSKKDSLMVLNIGGDRIQTRELNWKKMNALKPLFHINIEGSE